MSVIGTIGEGATGLVTGAAALASGVGAIAVGEDFLTDEQGDYSWTGGAALMTGTGMAVGGLIGGGAMLAMRKAGGTNPNPYLMAARDGGFGGAVLLGIGGIQLTGWSALFEHG